ncbi:hypothetical protein ABTZ58_35905 [Streptomyces sp. NPDC094143]
MSASSAWTPDTGPADLADAACLRWPGDEWAAAGLAWATWPVRRFRT